MQISYILPEQNVTRLLKELDYLKQLKADPFVNLGLEIRTLAQQQRLLFDDGEKGQASLDRKKNMRNEIENSFSQKLKSILCGEEYVQPSRPTVLLPEFGGISIPPADRHPSDAVIKNERRDLGSALLPTYRLALESVVGLQTPSTKARYKDCANLLQLIQNTPQIRYEHEKGGKIMGIPSSNLIDCLKSMLQAGFRTPTPQLLNGIRSGRNEPASLRCLPGLKELLLALSRTYLGSSSIKNPALRAYFEFCRQNGDKMIGDSVEKKSPKNVVVVENSWLTLKKICV
jgi:hypothetical protein